MTEKTPLETPAIPAGPLLSQLAGMPEARAWADGVALDVAMYRAKRLGWSEIDSGCVLHGPPGTGKTTLARALATTARMPLIPSSYNEWSKRGRYGIDVVNAIRGTFDLAHRYAPCVIAMDELDSLPARQLLSETQDSTYMIVNAMLEQLDGLSKREGVIVIGTCNHPDKLDPAMVRPGRLGRSIHVPLPTLESLPQILRFHLGKDASRMGDLASIAVMCVGMSGADIEHVIRDARTRARRASRAFVPSDLIAQIQARSGACDSETELRIALHEAAYAVALDRLLKITGITLSLARRGNAVRMVSTDLSITRDVLSRRICVLLAGRAAEEVFLGAVSGCAGGNANSALARATRMALSAFTGHGLSQSGGTYWHDPGRAIPGGMADEARSVLDGAYAHIKQLLQDEADLVASLTDTLIKKRALTYQDFLRLDNRSPACNGAAAEYRQDPPPLPPAQGWTCTPDANQHNQDRSQRPAPPGYNLPQQSARTLASRTGPSYPR